MKNHSLKHFDRAKQEFELAASIDEVKDIRDKSEAIHMYLMQSGQSLQIQNKAAEINIRAERRMGKLIPGEVRGQGERGKPERSHDVTFEEKPTLEELGIEPMQSHRYQLIASVPEKEFEDHIESGINVRSNHELKNYQYRRCI